MYDKKITPTLDVTLGYYYFMDKKHPLGDKKGRVWYHRHVASVSRGKWLEPHEVVHHLDGDKSNNSPSNLTIVSRAHHGHLHHKRIPTKRCPMCHEPFSPINSRQVYCSRECIPGQIKITPEEISQLVWEAPIYQIAERLNVSDAAIHKFCKRHSIKKPPRGYWLKK